MQEVKLFTDGACAGNPGIGGCACIMVSGEHRKQLTAGFKRTTNNRMELRAALMGLEAIKKKDVKVIIYSDAKYLTDSFNKRWIFNWEKENFNGRKNGDLFQRILELCKSFAVYEFIWIKGHNGHTENEDCDGLAVAMSHSNPQTIDEGYIEEVKNE